MPREEITLYFSDGVCQEGDGELQRFLDEGYLNSDEIHARFQVLPLSGDSQIDAPRAAATALCDIADRVMVLHIGGKDYRRARSLLKETSTATSLDIEFMPHIMELYLMEEWATIQRGLSSIRIKFNINTDVEEASDE